MGSSAKFRAPQVGPTRGRRGAVHVEIIAGGHNHLNPGILLCCAPHLLADSKLGPGFAGWMSARALGATALCRAHTSGETAERRG